jgi:hypothetical protein
MNSEKRKQRRKQTENDAVDVEKESVHATVIELLMADSPTILHSVETS